MKHIIYLCLFFLIGCYPYKSSIIDIKTNDCSQLITSSVDDFSKDTTFRSPFMFTTKEYGVKITKSSFLSLNFVKNGNVVRKYMSVDGISLTPVVLEDDVVFLFTDDTQLHIKCKVKGNVKSDLYGNSNYTANAFFQIDDNSLNQFAQKKVKGFKIGIATKNYLTETEQIFFNNVANCFKEKFRY